ncbi:MAG: hypothetical protein ABIN01_08765 [Ferruginibacter sp.]
MTIEGNTSQVQVNMPIDVRKVSGDWYVVNLLAQPAYFKEPFFLDTLLVQYNIGLQKISPDADCNLVRFLDYGNTTAALSLVPIDEFIAAFESRHLENKPTFIFHMARCGSTLVTQMLNECRYFYTISEPPVINMILDPGLNLPETLRLKLFKAVIHSIASTAPVGSAQTVIKFRSWNILYLKQIIDIFPGCSWLFIHRNSAEVLASIVKKPPGWLRSKDSYAAFFSTNLAVSNTCIHEMSANEFIARLLGLFCKIAGHSRNQKSHFVDYENFQSDLFAYLDSLTEIEITTEEKKSMLTSLRLYSKDVTRMKIFENDSLVKIHALDAEQMTLTEKFAETERHKL